MVTCTIPPDDGIPLPDGRLAAAQTVGSGAAARVYLENPIIMLPSRTVPLIGTVTPSSIVATSGAAQITNGEAIAGPLVPELGRPIRLTITGAFTGPVQVLRSTDGGVTKLPITAGGQPVFTFAGPMNEALNAETEAGATYYLDIAVQSGSLTYRMSQ